MKILNRPKLPKASVAFVLLATASLPSCSSGPTERERLEEELSYTETECNAKSIAYSQATIPQLEGEWDLAAAENIDTISPEGEWEIRVMLGKEMGLHPSEVNGWREIYRNRAKQAKSQQGKVSQEIELARRARDVACREQTRLERELDAMPIDEE